MENSITINGNILPIRGYRGHRVVTFKDVDTVHCRPEGTARKRFNDNRQHFIYGTDYFVRKTDEAKNEFGITAPNGLTLITESGYLMLAKTFTDDLAWAVQRELVNNYFRAELPDQLPAETAEILNGTETTYKGEPVITIADIAQIAKVKHIKAYQATTFLCQEGDDYVHINKTNLADFRVENPGFKGAVNNIIMLKATGVQKLLKYFGVTNEAALPDKSPVTTVFEASPKESKITDEDCATALKVLCHLKSACEANERELSEIKNVIKGVGALLMIGNKL